MTHKTQGEVQTRERNKKTNHSNSPLRNLRNLLEEIRSLHLLLRSRPTNIDRKQMREDSLTDWYRQTPKEEEAVKKGGWRES